MPPHFAKSLSVLCISTTALIISHSTFAADDSTAIAAAAMQPKVVLELFTSQGCSSCPPADRVLEKLAAQPNVVALSRPVQYWDRLGWKDTLATPENTALQFAYAKTWSKVGAYTPQLVIDGTTDVVGNQENTIRQKIDELAENKSGVVVNSTTQTDGSVVVTLSGNVSTRAEIHWLLLRASTLVSIGRGENTNARVRYINTVTAEKIIGEWNGNTQTVVINPHDFPHKPGQRWAILVQEPGPGHILGADYIGAEFSAL